MVLVTAAAREASGFHSGFGFWDLGLAAARTPQEAPPVCRNCHLHPSKLTWKWRGAANILCKGPSISFHVHLGEGILECSGIWGLRILGAAQGCGLWAASCQGLLGGGSWAMGQTLWAALGLIRSRPKACLGTYLLPKVTGANWVFQLHTTVCNERVRMVENVLATPTLTCWAVGSSDGGAKKLVPIGGCRAAPGALLTCYHVFEALQVLPKGYKVFLSRFWKEVRNVN